MAATLPAYLLTIRVIVPRPQTYWLRLPIRPCSSISAMAKTAFFSAALLGGALLLFDTHPLAAGVLIGLMAYKPQFGLLIPLVLLATGRWGVDHGGRRHRARGLRCDARTVRQQGLDRLCRLHQLLTRHIVLEASGTGWEKIQSLFSAVRMWGGSIDAGYAAQGALALAAAAGLIWLCAATPPMSSRRPRWPAAH
jgi:alpha-1,2-mannosyltransferase